MNPSKSQASAVRAESETGARILQPSGWPMPKGYANGITAEGRIVVTGGMIVKAYVIVAPGVTPDAKLVAELQEHVKREIAPYKYPRAIEYVAQLPKTQTGKLQRFTLRQMAQGKSTWPGVAAE